MDADLKAAAFQAECAALRFRLAALRLRLALRYNPNWHLQPRVPAGNSDGGQWTDIGGDAEGGNRTQLAQGDRLEGYPIDLREEERRGGHTIREHVGKSHRYLMERVEREGFRIVERGDLFRGLSRSSFASLDAATRLVNATLAQNQDATDRVARGERPLDLLTARFPSATGYQAHLPRLHAQPFIRETFGVRVIIVRDPGTERGFRILTAYPVR